MLLQAESQKTSYILERDGRGGEKDNYNKNVNVWLEESYTKTLTKSRNSWQVEATCSLSNGE